MVPKLSLQNGLVYTYTKEPDTRTPADDPWYLTALDFRTGKTTFKRLAGLGLGFNNNYAPVTSAPTAPRTWASWAGWWRCATRRRRPAWPGPPGPGRSCGWPAGAPGGG